jgi:hypothetical protein
MTVLTYVDMNNRQVGDPEHIKVFANPKAAETWFAENDPEGDLSIGGRRAFPSEHPAPSPIVSPVRDEIGCCTVV